MKMSRTNLKWGLAGILLIAFHIALARLSTRFPYEQGANTKPILTFVGIEIAAGVVYLLAIASRRQAHSDRELLIWVIAVGFVMRAAFFFSVPALEDDFYRYLWDGAVTAHGENPYAFSPTEVLGADEKSALPSLFSQLAEESGNVIWRINHPDLRTIYPPVAQGAFALAYLIKPWNLTAWRLILFAFDSVTLGLLALLLRRLKLPLLGLAIYWWNPLLIREIFNSGHMDVVVLPFALGAILLAFRRQFVLAAGLLGIAVGAKVWPVVLLPVLLRPMLSQPRKLAACLAVFGVVSGAMFLPVLRTGIDQNSGFTAYSQGWELNDALFMTILWAARSLVEMLGYHGVDGQLVARVWIGLLIGALIVWQIQKRSDDESEICEKCLLVVAAIFLLSPAQFPWYGVWIVPFLALRPRWSLLLLTTLLPLYYLRFYFSARNNAKLFDHWIVWLEYVPVWALLAHERFVARRTRLQSFEEVIA